MKKLINIIISIAIIMSLAIPCFAEDGGVTPVPYTYEDLAAKLRCFPQLSTQTRKTQYAYTFSLQMFLDGKNEKYGTILRNNGGIDGDYYTGTAEAVAEFQADVLIANDGICGSDTWEQVGLGLYETYNVSSNLVDLSAGDNLVFRATTSSPFIFYYAPPAENYPTWVFLQTCRC